MGNWLQHDWHQLHCGWPQPVTSWLVYTGYIMADSSWLLHRWPQSQQPGVWWETGKILRCSQAVMRLAAAEVREDSRSLVAVRITVLWYFLCNTQHPCSAAGTQRWPAGLCIFPSPSPFPCCPTSVLFAAEMEHWLIVLLSYSTSIPHPTPFFSPFFIFIFYLFFSLIFLFVTLASDVCSLEEH